ncbi:MAG: ATP-binding protein [Gammaproteobacteria bacterium]
MKSGASDSRRIAVALERIARALEGGAPAPEEFDGGGCFRWRAESGGGGGVLHPIPFAAADELPQLRGLDRQILLVERNTRAFLRGRPSNHVLLTGPRGAGKSSVARGVLARHAARLRLIETDAEGLSQLPRLLPALAARREKFVVYCDDLSFARGASAVFQRLKSALDGGLSAARDNVRVYATSNRRRLAPEHFADNSAQFNDEIHGGETAEETVALSDRFGLWVPFFDISPEEYDRIAAGWLAHFGVRATPATISRARRWAEERGSMNGRMARHFAAAAAAKTAGD